MDALPNIGHACATFTSSSDINADLSVDGSCGHNLIAIAGVGIALAIRHALQVHDVPGKVVLLGTPGKSICYGHRLRKELNISPTAEESGGGKIVLLERGGYKDMDLCVMCDILPPLIY
jgi:metal-dependent amidase/aminoacylase/carboxypeptidase family protein